MATTDALQRKRLRLLLRLFVGFITVLVIFRVGYWMIIKADWLREKALVQWVRELPVEPQRGNIQDRNKHIIAASVASDTVVLHPKAITEEQIPQLVDDLSKILNIDRATIEKKARKRNYSVVWLDRQITPEQSQKIRELKSSGVSLTEDKKRYYPLGNFLTQVLGFTSVDGEGLEGIESRFDQYLRGTPGSIVTETDRDGYPLPGTYEEYIEPIDGNNITLTIDLAIQSYTEKAMDLCLKEKNAKSAMAIVMDCNTGEILAMVNKPDFDNNEPPRHDIDLLRSLTRNSSIADVYEPGSTFKLVTTASALNSGAINTNYATTCVGFRIIDGQKIKCWSDRPHGYQNLTQVLQNSCNPAFMDMADKMGLNTFYDYIYDFGFGKASGIELYGEAIGIVNSPKYVRRVDLARIGFGQAIAITPLQLVSAVSAIVNGGNLMKPYIIKEITTPQGEVLKSYNSEIVRNVISYETSSIMCELMQAVVDNGSGRNAQIEGYKIGGKTGTAQKYGENGAIIPDKHISSFIAAAPMDDPQVVVLVVVNEPNAGLDYGSIVAAPYAKMILEDSLPYLSIMPEYDSEDNGTITTMPDVTGMSREQAQSKLRSHGIKSTVEGYEGDVVEQIPAPGMEIYTNSTALLLLEKEDDQNIDLQVEIPDLSGLSAVEANNVLVSKGLCIKIKGTGSIVISQMPQAGEMAYMGDIVTVEFGYPKEDDEE